MLDSRSRPPSPSSAPRMRREEGADSTSTTAGLTTLPIPLQSSTSTPASELWDPLDMPSRDKERMQPTLDITVTNDVLCLKGPGTEVEPVLLSGNVILYLPENTHIKDITLRFRGKAKLPPSHDSCVPKPSVRSIECLILSLGCPSRPLGRTSFAITIGLSSRARKRTVILSKLVDTASHSNYILAVTYLPVFHARCLGVQRSHTNCALRSTALA